MQENFDQQAAEPEYARGDDKLFRCDQPDWVYNACLNYMPEKLSVYADGYKEGADALVNVCLDTPNGGQLDILVYPIVFLYRHYLELRLKEMIKGLRFLRGTERGYPQHHRIDQLWILFKNLYVTQVNTKATQDFINTERLILEFAAIDAGSMTFRYPEDLQGNVGYTENINLRNLGEVMNRIATLVEGVSWQVAHMVDNSYEKRNER